MWPGRENNPTSTNNNEVTTANALILDPERRKQAIRRMTSTLPIRTCSAAAQKLRIVDAQEVAVI